VNSKWNIVKSGIQVIIVLNMKIKILLLIVLALSLNACSNDDNAKSEHVIGRWKVETKEQFNCTIESRNQFFTDNSTWEFRTDQTYSIVSNSGTTTVNATYEGPSGNYINLCYQGTCSSYTFLVSGSELTLTETGSTDCLLRYTFVRL
jgi:hypothetical protein